MPVRVKVNTSGADALFQRMGWTIKNSLPGYVQQEARLIAVQLAEFTFPRTQISGQISASRDIYRVYTTPGEAFKDIDNPGLAKGFWAAATRSNWTRAQAILQKAGKTLRFTPIQSFDGGAQHRQLRNNRGGINQGQKAVMIVRDPSRLKTYIQAEQKKVGFGKGGWAACARVLGGTRGIPGWVSRQKAPGQVVENYSEERSKVSMTNQVPYASEIISQAGIDLAEITAYNRLAKSIRQAFRFRRT